MELNAVNKSKSTDKYNQKIIWKSIPKMAFYHAMKSFEKQWESFQIYKGVQATSKLKIALRSPQHIYIVNLLLVISLINYCIFINEC